MELLGNAKAVLYESWARSPWTTLLTVAFPLFVLTTINVIIYRIWFHPLARFPGPKPLASTGFIALWRTHISGNFVREVAQLHRRYGPIVRVGPNHLALDGSIGWPQVYAHRTDRPEPQKVRGFFHPEDHIGLIATDRENHRRQRRILAHAFSDTALVEQQPIILQYIDTFMERLSEYAKKGEKVNIVDLLNFLTFDIIGDLTFGESFGGLQRNDYHPWVRFILEGVRNVGAIRLAVFYPIILPFLPFVFGKEFMDSAVASDRLSESKAAARIERGEKEGRRDFMTYMTKKDENGAPGITYREQIVNSPLLIGAGSETTATALSGLFFYMGNEPKLLKKLTEEIRGAFKSEAEIDLRSTAKLVYLHACIEETLRIYPPAAETSPRVSPGIEIENTFVPKGTLLSVHQWATFRNPENFADPDSFRPERWLPETHELYNTVFAHDNRAVFKPFSHGPRNCIGKTLAYAEMRTILCRMLYRFDVELVEGQGDWHEKQLSYIVWVKGPLYIRLKYSNQSVV